MEGLMMATATSFVSPDMFKPDLLTWPFTCNLPDVPDLVPGAYDFIMIDPPWRFMLRSDKGEEKSAQAQYKTMSIEEIKALPVADLAREDCILWLWATAPMMEQQYAVVRTWGFKPVTQGVWVKKTVNNKINFGTGYVLRGSHEPFIIAKRGEPQTTKGVRSVIEGLIREHSRKPEEGYAAAEKLMPHARRCEVFARTQRPGWDVSGDEVGKFEMEDA